MTSLVLDLSADVQSITLTYALGPEALSRIEQSHFIAFYCHRQRILFLMDASQQTFETVREADSARQSNSPTQAKPGLEWATRADINAQKSGCNYP